MAMKAPQMNQALKHDFVMTAVMAESAYQFCVTSRNPPASEPWRCLPRSLIDLRAQSARMIPRNEKCDLHVLLGLTPSRETFERGELEG